MDDVMNRFAQELAEAIKLAVKESPEVKDCNDRAREAGFEMRVSLEAVVSFVSTDSRVNLREVTRITTPSRMLTAGTPQHSKETDLTTNDRRFLRALKIGADQPKAQ